METNEEQPTPDHAGARRQKPRIQTSHDYRDRAAARIQPGRNDGTPDGGTSSLPGADGTSNGSDGAKVRGSGAQE